MSKLLSLATAVAALPVLALAQGPADFQGNEVPYVYPAAGRAVRIGVDGKH